LALGAANVASAFTGGFAINGSPPRTAASDAAGGRTPVVNLVMVACIALLLVFFTGVFDYVPSVVLDALVLGIGVRLVAVGELQRIYRARRAEAAVAVLALLVVAFVGVEQGLLVAVMVALADRLRRQYHPHDEVLVLDGRADRRIERRVGRRLDGLDGVVVYRFGSSLFFENSDVFDARVRTLLSQVSGTPRAVVLDARAIEDVDYTAGRMLDRLHADLRGQGCDLIVAEGSPELHAALRRLGLGDLQFADDLEETVLALRRL
ncbi:MAG: SulP family inorganic anion transporter, partial [Actinomycetes bacterium]